MEDPAGSMEPSVGVNSTMDCLIFGVSILLSSLMYAVLVLIASFTKSAHFETYVERLVAQLRRHPFGQVRARFSTTRRNIFTFFISYPSR